LFVGKILIATIYLSPNEYTATGLRQVDSGKRQKSRISVNIFSD